MTDKLNIEDVLAAVRRELHTAVDAALDSVLREVLEPVAMSPTEALQDEIARLEYRLNTFNGTGDDVYRFGAELHGNLKRAKSDLDAIPASDPQRPAVEAALKNLTNRVLREIFGVEDAA